MSASQSPPRKRVRNHRIAAKSEPVPAQIRTSMIHSDDVNLQNKELSPGVSSGGQHKTRKMKFEKNRSRQRSSNNGASATEDGPPICDVLTDDENDISSDDDSCGSSTLLRKVKRRANLSATDTEIVRLIGQHLTNIGLKTSADVLMKEAGCRLDQPSAATFKKFVLSGEWSQAVRALDDLCIHLENTDHIVEMKFLLLEQKYLEFLSRGNAIEALKVLQNELTPLKHNQTRTHELSSYLMYSDPEIIARLTQTHRNGSSQDSRLELMERLQAYLPAAVMLPPRRLLNLLSQAAAYQTERCLYHYRSSGSPDLDPSYLAVDHVCPRDDFPCETVQVLSEHCDEVLYCRFSPDGLKLATGSKDNTVIIWDFDPDSLLLKLNKCLERHTRGVAYFAWSPDSTKLAVCGQEDCDEVYVWNVDTGLLDFKISHSSEDTLTSVSWSPDGNKLCCGGTRGQFYQCDNKGIVIDSWEGIRVQGLAYRKDGKTILAADTHHRIRSYNFEELSDCTMLQEDHPIVSFCTDESDQYAVTILKKQGLHLWDIKEKCLLQKYVGVVQDDFAVHCSFGGVGQNFIASGSEDCKVYIYHLRKESPIAVLSGHSKSVNCVAWNPVYPQVIVSASDDCTARVWAPAERFRKKLLSNNATSQQNGNFSDGANSFSNGVI